MRLGAIDIVWLHLPPKQRFQRIADLGFEGVQLWFTSQELGFEIPISWNPKPYQINPISKKKVMKILYDVGLEISALGPQIILGEEPQVRGQAGIPFSSPERRKERISNIKAYIDFAAEIDVKTIIMFSGGDPTKKEEQWGSFIELTQEIVDYAEKVDILLAIENMVQLLVDDDDTLVKLINEIGSKNLRINFDPKNLNITPPGGRNIPDATRRLRGLIAHAHIGDSVYGGGEFGKSPKGFVLPPLGEGEVPIEKCLQALRDIQYNKWIVFEHLDPSPYERERIVYEGKKLVETIVNTF